MLLSTNFIHEVKSVTLIHRHAISEGVTYEEIKLIIGCRDDAVEIEIFLFSNGNKDITFDCQVGKDDEKPSS